VSLSLSNGHSSLEVEYEMCVAEEPNKSLLAMDFLTDFQCVLDMASEENITLNRIPREPLTKYKMPYLDLQLGVGNGQAFHVKTLVDTGSWTLIALAFAKTKKIQIGKQSGKHYYKVNSPLKLALGNSSRTVKNVEACDFPNHKLTLGYKDLKQTVISIKDWSMTFTSGKGNITLPFLKK